MAETEIDWSIRYVEMGAGDCWIWTGHTDQRGYGKCARGRLAHRMVREILLAEPIPAGLELDHLCRVAPCVNPDHNEPVTPAENMRRRYRLAPNHCRRGHEYTDENTYRHGGRRHCRTCQRIREGRRCRKLEGIMDG